MFSLNRTREDDWSWETVRARERWWSATDVGVEECPNHTSEGCIIRSSWTRFGTFCISLVCLRINIRIKSKCRWITSLVFSIIEGNLWTDIKKHLYKRVVLNIDFKNGVQVGQDLCSGLLHYKPMNTNLWQYPLVVSSICCAPREKKVSAGWSETVYWR